MPCLGVGLCSVSRRPRWSLWNHARHACFLIPRKSGVNKLWIVIFNHFHVTSGEFPQKIQESMTIEWFNGNVIYNYIYIDSFGITSIVIIHMLEIYNFLYRLPMGKFTQQSMDSSWFYPPVMSINHELGGSEPVLFFRVFGGIIWLCGYI